MTAQLEMVLDEDPATDQQGAEMSADGKYRYRLWRTWTRFPDRPGRVLWVMLNPSTADHKHNDPTIRRCIEFTKAWGYGGLEVVNMFALRATNPKELVEAADPIGQYNEMTLRMAAGSIVVAAWGASLPKGSDTHVATVRSMLERSGAMCLGHTKAGHPKHPLYLAKTTELVPL